MTKLLEIRAILRAYYQKFQSVINPVVKFIVAFVVFHMINKAIGYDVRLTKFPVEALLALLCTFTPSSVLVLLAMVLSLAHIYSVAQMLAIMVVLVFIILYCFFFRYAPRYGYAVVAIPLLYTLKIPFAVPIFLGLTANPITILPVSCGVVIYHLFGIIQGEVTNDVSANLDDILALYTRVIDALVDNKQMMLEIAVFALVILAVFLVRSLKIDYAFEISIAVGAVVCIIGFLIGNLKLNLSGNTGTTIFGTLGSAVIVLIIQFFKRVLDYTATESVQFEDDDYYYYVKAVPKIDITVPQMHVKHINEKKEKPEQIKQAQQTKEDEEVKKEYLKQKELERRLQLRQKREREHARTDGLKGYNKEEIK